MTIEMFFKLLSNSWVNTPIYSVLCQTTINSFLLLRNETKVVLSLSVEQPMKLQKKR